MMRLPAVTRESFSLLNLRRLRRAPEVYEHALDLMAVLYSAPPADTGREWLNLGAWTPETHTFEQACDHLATRMAEEGHFGPDDHILDVGCGTGTSTRFWHDLVRERTGRSPDLVGVNITPSHIRKAREHQREHALHRAHIHYVQGDATALRRLGVGPFTRVAALESAFHFDPRERFFREAYAVLQPGGRLVACDIVTRPRVPTYHSLRRYLPEVLVRAPCEYLADLVACPVDNHIDMIRYTQQLQAAGFRNIRHRSLWDQAAPTLALYQRRVAEIRKGRIPPWLEPWDAEKWQTFHALFTLVVTAFPFWDYVMVSADKPA